MSAPTWLAELLMNERDKYPRRPDDMPSEELAEVIAAELRARLESDEMIRAVVREEDALWTQTVKSCGLERAGFTQEEGAITALAAVTDELLGGSDADE